MRSLRSRPADHQTVALARARVAYLTGAGRTLATPAEPGGRGGLSGSGEPSESGGPKRSGDPNGSAEPNGSAPRHRPWPDADWADAAHVGEVGRDGDVGRDDDVGSYGEVRGDVGRDDDVGSYGEVRGGDGRYGEVGGGSEVGRDGAVSRSGGSPSPDPPTAPHGRAPLAVGTRLALERTHLAVIVLVVLVGVIGAVVVFLLARPEVVPIEPELVATGTPAVTGTDAADGQDAGAAGPDPGAQETDPSGSAPPGAGSTASGAVVVHVAGLVARPGVVELPAGSRVVDAIEAAGGATADADLTPINLARILTDGEQVLVTADPPPAAPPAPPAGGTGTATPSTPVNLNTATAAELETLPGIGPALAGRIIDWREQNGRFTTIDELREVAGIGEQRFAQLEPLVTL